MHSPGKTWLLGPSLRIAGQSDRRLITRVGTIVALTAVLLTAFFSYTFFELYGESELCRQKYHLPPLSFYSGRFDCFIVARELAAEVAHILALVAGPLLPAFMTVLWVDWPRRSAKPGGQQLALATNRESERVDAVAEAQLLFWVLTAALGVALVVGLALWAVGSWWVSLNQVFGTVLFYAFHLYPASLLTFAAVRSVGWLGRAAAAVLPR